MSKPVLKSIKAVQEELGISMSIIYKWLKDGKITGVENPKGKGVLLSAGAIATLKKGVRPKKGNAK